MLIPATRYADCETALAFLTDVLGLTPEAVFRDATGAIVHAQLRLGRGLMMFGPDDRGEFARFMTSPCDAGGRETTVIYAVLPELDTLQARLDAHGAEIVVARRTEPHGGESLSVRDPGGHVWTFGTYDPEAA